MFRRGEFSNIFMIFLRYIYFLYLGANSKLLSPSTGARRKPVQEPIAKYPSQMFCYFSISFISQLQHHRFHPNVNIKQTELRQFVASGDFLFFGFQRNTSFVLWCLHGTWNHTKNHFLHSTQHMDHLSIACLQLPFRIANSIP